MKAVFVLLTTQNDPLKTIIKKLTDVAGVKEIYEVEGLFDIIVLVEGKTMIEVNAVISEQIKRIQNVRFVLPLMVMKKA